MNDKLDRLNDYLQSLERAAIHFTCDRNSAYLLYAANDAGIDIHAFFVKTAFVPDWVRARAEAYAKLMLINMTVIYSDILSLPEIAAERHRRCQLCRSETDEIVRAAAAQNGYSTVLCALPAEDGESGEIPPENGILAPFRECGLSSDMISAAYREANLPPIESACRFCLAEQTAAGAKLTPRSLYRIEHAEAMLWKLGLTDYRVRNVGGSAIIEIAEAEFPRAQELRGEIQAAIAEDFKSFELVPKKLN